MTSFLNALEWWQWALIDAVVIGCIGVLIPAVFLPSFKSPIQGVKYIVLLLPIYTTSNGLLLILNDKFDSAQVPILVDLFAAITFAGLLLNLQSWELRTPRPITTGLFLFVIASCLSCFNTVSWRRSTIAIIVFTQLALITFCIESVVTNEERVKMVWRWWYWSYLVVLFFGVVGIATVYLGIPNVANFNGVQVTSTFRFPNQLSLYLIITAALMWPVAALRSTPKKVRRIVVWSMPVMLAVLWYSGSRSGAAGFIAAAATLMVLTRHVRILLVGALVCSAVGLVLIAYNIGSMGNFAKGSSRYAIIIAALEGESTAQHSPFEFYETGANVAVDAFVVHPAIGGGIGAVLDFDTTPGQPYEVHNTFLGLAGQTGTLGLVISLGIMLFAVRNAWRARVEARSPFLKAVANGCLAALVGFVIHGFANFDWRIRHVWLLLAFTSGVYIAARRSLQPVEQVAVTRTARVYPDIRVAAR
jgi:O-antigen ligase